jgi:hypothetical protein
MQTSESVLQQRLRALKDLQDSAVDLVFSGGLSTQELNDMLDMIPQLQLEAVQVETALTRIRHLRTTN